jgi:ABC-2 type transport system permease protein
MFRSLFLKSLRDYRYSLLGWAIGFIFISFYLMYFYPYISRTTEILDVVDKLPSFIKNLIGEKIKLTSPAGFFSIQPFSMIAPLLFLIFGIQKAGDAIAGEHERKTLDLLLALPISRTKVAVEKLAAIGVSIFFLGLSFWIGMAAGSVIFHVSLNFFHLAEAILSCCMLGLFFAGFTLSLSCLFLRKKIAAGIVSAFAIVTYLINAYAPMVSELQPYRTFSPFYYYNGADPLINGINLFHFFVLLVLILLFTLFSVLIFKRVDF